MKYQIGKPGRVVGDAAHEWPGIDCPRPRARRHVQYSSVIMITSRSTEKHRSQAAAAGVDVYLTKPFGDEELLQHVTELTAA